MDSGSERREFGRVHLMAHGRSIVCSVNAGGESGSAALIDISAGGARIRCASFTINPEVKTLSLCVNNVNDKGLLQNLAGEIRWRNGHELGIQFKTELDVTLRTLQDLVS